MLIESYILNWAIFLEYLWLAHGTGAFWRQVFHGSHVSFYPTPHPRLAECLPKASCRMHVCVPHTAGFWGSAACAVGSGPTLIWQDQILPKPTLFTAAPRNLCPKGLCLEPNRSGMDYKPAQTPKDYMICLWLWNHLRTGNKPHQGCQWARWRKQNEDLGLQWILRGSLPSEPCPTRQKLNKQKTYALCVNYALSVNYTAFHEENNGTCGVLIIFLSNLGKQNNESLGTEKKRGGLHGQSGEPPIPPLNAEIFKKVVMRILSLPQMLPSYNSLYL